MFNNTTNPLTSSSFSFCSLEGGPRNYSAVLNAITISTSAAIALLSPVAVVGNALIMAAIWKNSSLRTPSYTLLRVLAFTDLCTGLITQPLYVATEFICLKQPRGINKQSPFLVPAIGIFAGCSVYFTSLSLSLITLISVERWLHMSRRTLLTLRRTCNVVIVLLLLLIPLAILGILYMLTKNYGFTLCMTLSVLLISCVFTTSIAYFKLFQIIRRHQRQIRANELTHPSSNPAFNFEKYKKSVFSMLYILGIFYISFVPFLLYVALVFWFYHYQIETLYKASVMFLFLTSSFNPLVYLWRMNDIRNGVKQLLKQLFCKDN